MRSIGFFFCFCLLYPLPCQGMRPRRSAPRQEASVGPFSLSRLAKVGDPAPDGGGFVNCCVPGAAIVLSGHHPLNNIGEMTFSAVTGPTGCLGQAVYLASGKTLTTVADMCTDTGTQFGRLVNAVGPANIDNAGRVAFSAFSSTPGPNGTHGLLLKNDSGFVMLTAAGDQTPYGTMDIGSCGFSEPFINDSDDVAFSSCTGADEIDGVFVMSNGQLHRLVKDGDLAPDGGMFFMNFFPPAFTRLNNRGDVLFQAGSARPSGQNVGGLFLYTQQGIQKVEVTGDILPDGNLIRPEYFGNGYGDLNDNGDVLFAVAFSKDPEAPGGLYVYSNGAITKIIGTGDPTPLGGTILSFLDKNANADAQFPNEFPIPAINASGTVLFRAELSGASSPFALFLASTKSKAMLKVVAVGDKLDTGEVIKQINSFALNDRGQVAFTANGKGKQPLGVFLATPASPSIISAKLKTKAEGSMQLVIDGANFITNDSMIEVNGTVLQSIKYPVAFQQPGGTTTRLISKDPSLSTLIPQGQTVQVTVTNRLTGATSVPFAFMR